MGYGNYVEERLLRRWSRPIRQSPGNAADYWLDVVKLLSDNSPVIVVMNKADVRGKPIDEAAYADKFKNIKFFLQVSCLDRRGIDELNFAIRQVLGRMPHLKDKLPKVWQAIRHKLEAEQKNYIDAARYYAICNSFGLDRGVISKHLEKIFGYDPHGLPENFIAAKKCLKFWRFWRLSPFLGTTEVIFYTLRFFS